MKLSVQNGDHLSRNAFIFDVRVAIRKAAPLFPEQLPEGAGFDQLIKQVMANEIIRGKLLSNDGELTLIVLALDPAVVPGKG